MGILKITEGSAGGGGGGNDDDDKVCVIYATAFTERSGATKFDAISVEDYRPRHKGKAFDLSPIPYCDDADAKVLPFSPKLRKRVYLKGECSYSKSEDGANSVRSLTFICEICADERHANEKFHILGCHHSCCAYCVRKYVASKLQDNVLSIKCPVSGCKGSLEPQHCQSILPEQVFSRWGDALFEAAILATEKFYCPFKDCSALLVHERKGENEIIAESECPNCNRLFCANCRVPWHSGVTCGEFKVLKEDERSSEDQMLMSLHKSMKWMRCPRCNIYVEKIK